MSHLNKNIIRPKLPFKSMLDGQKKWFVADLRQDFKTYAAGPFEHGWDAAEAAGKMNSEYADKYWPKTKGHLTLIQGGAA